MTGPERADGVCRWDERIVLDGRHVSERLAADVPELAGDLLEVAAVLYAADRRTVRTGQRADPSALRWRRSMRAEIPVRAHERWSAPQVYRPLVELLEWLTGDEWVLSFRPAQARTGPLTVRQPFLFTLVPDNPEVVLFSGGLDSTAGLVTQAASGGQAVLAVSVSTNTRMTNTQQTVATELGGSLGLPIRWVCYQLHLTGKPPENTQRSRGLLFLSAAVATAWIVRANSATVLENGIGAWNLPYTRAQVGPQATRSMHPRTLRLMEELATGLAGERFVLKSPNLYRTKAEMIAACPPAADPALAASQSCDSAFSSRVPGRRPCGTCTSCLLRRQALIAGGRRALDSATDYVKDIRSPQWATRCDNLAAMLWQVGRLSHDLAAPDPWAAMIDDFPELLDAPEGGDPATQRLLLDMFGRYGREWVVAAGELGVDLTPWTGATPGADAGRGN